MIPCIASKDSEERPSTETDFASPRESSEFTRTDTFEQGTYVTKHLALQERVDEIWDTVDYTLVRLYDVVTETHTRIGKLENTLRLYVKKDGPSLPLAALQLPVHCSEQISLSKMARGQKGSFLPEMNAGDEDETTSLQAQFSSLHEECLAVHQRLDHMEHKVRRVCSR